MRPFVRVFPLSLTTLALFGCAAGTALWIRSYYTLDTLPLGPGDAGRESVVSYRGEIYMADVVVDPSTGRRFIARLGGHGSGISYLSVVTTLGFMAGAFGFWSRSAMRSPREAGPRCPACGYDLTGNVSGVCSECGMKVG